MKTGVILCSLIFLSAPVLAWAGTYPDFNADAKPILRTQPGLLNYVRAHFEVKEIGKAKYPGDDDRRPAPPYIFRARPIGSGGPFNISLLIQPGPAGRILCVVPPSNGAPPQQQPPSQYAQQPSQQEPPPQPFQPQEAQPSYQSPTLSQGEVKPIPSQPAQNPAPQQPAPSAPTADTPSGPTADTPSGPIAPSSTTGSSNPQQNLAPPPDPAPGQ